MVRFAKKSEFVRINELRRQVNDLHVEGRPTHFKSGFCEELQNYLQVFFDDPDRAVIVCEHDGVICGFAMVRHVRREETHYRYADAFYEVEEFCVDAAHRRQGVATELFAFIKSDAKSHGFDRIDLNMWEFNTDALAFYEAMGMTTYRRYMELQI